MLEFIGRRHAVATSLLALVLAGCGGGSSDNAPPPIARVVALGDSNIDNGNLLRLSGGAFPAQPNWQGRNSNGPNVVEYLAKGLNATLDDYAVSGATTRQGNIVPDNTVPGVILSRTGVAGQVADLEKAGAHFTESDLVVLWAGSNDIYGVQRADRATLDQRIATAAGNIQSAIDKLGGLGARRFLVANRTPREALGTDNDLNGVDLNKAIDAAVAQARSKTGADVRLYDAYGAIADMMKNPGTYGFKEVNTLCWNVPACANDPYAGGLPVANTYVNWDGAHKTTRVHQLMAEQITQMLKN